MFNFHSSKLKFLLPIGLQLISVDENSQMCLIDVRNKELVAEVPFHNHLFKISAILHPSTYINKVLLGSEQGSLQLFNVRKQKTIYTFKGWGQKVTCLCQSPVIDVVAIGLANGDIYLHNLKSDTTLIRFNQEWGEVVRLSFRTDGASLMVSTSNAGHMAIWDLENERLHRQIRNVHNGPITGCEFIHQEALLVTSSSDNRLKVWRFDELNDRGLLLHSREGHSLPPTKIRFYSESGHQILSASADCTLRNFSIYSERLHKSLGTATTNRKLAKRMGADKDPYKMNAITDFAFQLTREKEFDNIVTLHADTLEAMSWSGDKCRLGEHRLMHKRFATVHGIRATAIELTTCGNFALIGYTTGHIDKFNIQSGLHRATFSTEEDLQRTPDYDAKYEVTCLAVDELSTTLISANAKKLKFWSMKSTKLVACLELKGWINKMTINRQSGLLAVGQSVSRSDYLISVVDVETRRVIREFNSWLSKINDFVFTSDCKWLIVAFEDKSCRVYDLVSAVEVDHFLFSSACKSLTISPNNEFLATSHVDQKGIFLWSNVTLYIPKVLRKLKSSHQPRLLDLPIARPDRTQEEEDEEDADQEQLNVDRTADEDQMEVEVLYKSPEQLSEELITLSALPTSRWKNLINLDLIKQRNKPTEPLEKPKDAPFFLPVTSGLNPQFDFGLENKKNDEDGQSNSRIINRLVAFTEFGEVLFNAGIGDKDYRPVLEKLKEMGPSAIDMEIRSLDSLPPANSGIDVKKPILLLFFLEAIDQLLALNTDFELLNSYLALFLKAHGDLLIKYPAYIKKARSILERLESSWDRIDQLFAENTSVLNYIRSAIL